MRVILGSVLALVLTAPVAARTPPQACWVEFASGDAPGAMGAAGANAAVWHNTASGVVIRRTGGDLLIDAGWSSKAEVQMAELAPQKQPIARRILASLTMRRSTPESLMAAGVSPSEVRTILPTHAHYDHLAGAEDLPGAAILLSPAERAFLAAQEAKPDIVAASNIRSVKARIRSLTFKPKPYLGFTSSLDLFKDGSVIIVPLSGHTPGSVGVFFSVNGKRVFHIGDAAWTGEAIDRGLPKPAALSRFADADPDAADRQVATLHQFAAAHPEIVILPAHDRDRWQAVFETPGCAVKKNSR